MQQLILMVQKAYTDGTAAYAVGAAAYTAGAEAYIRTVRIKLTPSS